MQPRDRRQNRGTFVALLSCLTLLSSSSGAVDVPIPGKVVKLQAKGDSSRRVFVFRSDTDPAITAPFPDPGAGASLFIFSSNGGGQCRAEIDLPAVNWQAIGKDGPNKGWRYRDSSGSAGGVQKILLRASGSGGSILVKAKGSIFPCGLETDSQALPLQVLLRVADTRYCAAFDDAKKNVGGSFKASAAPAPAECPSTDLTVVTLNVVHGLACPPETAFCRLEDRIDLLGQWIAGRGCPDVLAFQEVFDTASGSSASLMAERLTDVCPFQYNFVYIKTNGVDDSLLLSRYPALETEIHRLHGPFRNVLFARLDHPIGPLDVFSTHLASGADLGPSPCETFPPCPAECVSAGAVSVRDCQAVQLAAFAAERHDVDPPAFVVGDFNVQPATFVYDYFVGRGWPDTAAAAGNAECDPVTGVGCTSGREDEDLTDLESPALNVDERIDYIFMIPPAAGTSCAGAIDSAEDDDGDGVATGLFAAQPNPFAAACGAAPEPICWVSDHSGVQADVNCE